MVEYCEICGEELDSDEENGICRKCKDTQKVDESKVDVDDYIDPGIT